MDHGSPNSSRSSSDHWNGCHKTRLWRRDMAALELSIFIFWHPEVSIKKKRKVFCDVYLWNRFQTHNFVLHGQFNMNELLCRWGETIICCSHPKAKLGNVRSTDTSDGIELTMEALCLHWTRTRPTSTGFRWFLHDIFLFEQNVNEPRRFLRGKWLQQKYEMYVQGNYSQAEQKIC